MLRWAALTLLVLPCDGFAGDLVFSGQLQRVGTGSISVKLSDRRVIDARIPNMPRLTAGKIAAQFKIGDQVQMTCKTIQQVWEEDTSRLQFLELTKLQFLREGEVPKPPPAPTVDAIRDSRLERAREVNLDYAANMPNFVADETGKRYTGNGKSNEWRFQDTIETEITFKGSSAVRRQIRRDGKPWDQPFQTLPGFKWSGGFGTEMRPLFDGQCPTTMRYEKRAEVRGKELLEYVFHSPPDGCFVPFTMTYQRYNPARTGHAFINPGGQVIQMDEDADGFPAEFEFVHRTEEVSWDAVKIGDASHFLPVGAKFVVLYSNGSRVRVDLEYKNHRHFQASTNVTFH